MPCFGRKKKEGKMEKEKKKEEKEKRKKEEEEEENVQNSVGSFFLTSKIISLPNSSLKVF